MIPVVFEPRRLSFLLAGEGDAALARLRWLRAGGAADVRVFAKSSSPELETLAGNGLERHLPDAADFRGVAAAFVAGLDEKDSAEIARTAKAAGVPVNVEDRIALCDFHVPAVVRRGDLLLTVSTGGQGPGLTVAIREKLEAAYGPEWAERLKALAERRTQWKAEGADFRELRRRTREWLDRQGWFD